MFNNVLLYIKGKKDASGIRYFVQKQVIRYFSNKILKNIMGLVKRLHIHTRAHTHTHTHKYTNFFPLYSVTGSRIEAGVVEVKSSDSRIRFPQVKSWLCHLLNSHWVKLL